MTLTEKEIKTLKAMGDKYEYVEVSAVGIGGKIVTVNKLKKKEVMKERKEASTAHKSLGGLPENDSIRKFVKSDNEIAEQKRANELNLPSSMR